DERVPARLRLALGELVRAVLLEARRRLGCAQPALGIDLHRGRDLVARERVPVALGGCRRLWRCCDLRHWATTSGVSASSIPFEPTSSCFASSLTVGNCGSILSSVSTSTADTATRMNHLWSAGITYHGACSVLVADSMSENAAWYSSQCARSLMSLALNFQ